MTFFSFRYAPLSTPAISARGGFRPAPQTHTFDIYPARQLMAGIRPAPLVRKQIFNQREPQALPVPTLKAKRHHRVIDLFAASAAPHIYPVLAPRAARW